MTQMNEAGGPFPVRAVATHKDLSVTMSLRGITVTPTAHHAVQSLAIILHDRPDRRLRPTKKYLAALGAVVWDLLTAGSYDPVRPCYRPMGSLDFADSPVSYKAFRTVIGDLLHYRYITLEKGYQGGPKTKGRVTRIRPTPRLFDTLHFYGLTASNRGYHFKLHIPDVTKMVVLKLRGRSWWEGPNKQTGNPVRFDPNAPEPKRLATETRALNAYLFKQRFDNVEFNGLFRGFNEGHVRNYAWNKGGRTYAAGGSVQSMERGNRRFIRINGHPVAEVDIKACFLTILHARYGVSPPRPDPYDIPGYPRDVVKSFVTAMLGKGRPPKRWSDDQLDHLLESDIVNVPELYPLDILGPIILDHLPVLTIWDHCEFNWADMHYAESQIIFKTMMTLAEYYDIPSLPVHDSLVVPKKDTEIVLSCLKNEFLAQTGLIPIISVK